ncbi:MAG: DUF2179 domain-containing protein [Candidatus Omnitrophica bacterium]|nr:DUF2179 domain-containing protein [Candidatus Omnitrophota bacterium]
MNTHYTLFQWIILPLLIFLVRIIDMSMDTIRILLLSKGKKMLAPILGFFQVLIWLLAIRQVFLNISNVACYIAYAGGFAMGTYVGIILEEKLAIGFQVIRIITKKDETGLINILRNKGYGVTSIVGEGATGKVNIIFTIVKRSETPQVLKTINEHNPNVFYTIEDVRMLNETIKATSV